MGTSKSIIMFADMMYKVGHDMGGSNPVTAIFVVLSSQDLYYTNHNNHGEADYHDQMCQIGKS